MFKKLLSFLGLEKKRSNGTFFVIVESTTYNDWRNNIGPLLKGKARLILKERWVGNVVCEKHNVGFCKKILKTHNIKSVSIPYALPTDKKRRVKKS